MVPPDHFQDENVASDYGDYNIAFSLMLVGFCQSVGEHPVKWNRSPNLYKHLLWYLFEAMWRALLSNSEY